MAIIFAACAALGLLCVCANLLTVIGEIVIALLKYVVGPVLLVLLIMGFITWASRGGL